MFKQLVDRTHTGSLKWDKYEGTDVLPMWVADMDFPSPPPVIQALRERVDHGVFGYTKPYSRVVDSVLNYLKSVHHIDCKEDWIVWLPGLVPALNLICRAFEGEVLTNTPIYPPFLTAPHNAGRKCRKIPLLWDGGRWKMNFEEMEKATGQDTAVFLLCNPQNPVGQVFLREELEQLNSFAAEHNIIVASDEIHCDLLLDPEARHVPFLSLGEGATDRCIALYAPSKTYNLPGLACSFAVIPDQNLRMAFSRAARGIITEVNAMGYAACRAAYEEGETWRLELIEQLRTNRDALQHFLREFCPEVGQFPIQATYLSWLDVRKLELTHPAEHFESFGVGLSDGKQFGAPGFLRMNFGCPPELLERGLQRFKQGVLACRKS